MARSIPFQHYGCCIDCGEELNRDPHSWRCWKCANAAQRFQALAVAAVQKAVAAGDLAHISTRLCVDCESPASQYDHRDYSKPLAVDPVCRKCNHRRGPAAYPLAKEAA